MVRTIRPKQTPEWSHSATGLMSHHEIRFGSIWRDFEADSEAPRELVPLIYRHVRIEDDNNHKGVYSPDTRDDAETTRGYLLSRVTQTAGRRTFETLMAFSQELPDQWSRDRMILLARRLAPLRMQSSTHGLHLTWPTLPKKLKRPLVPHAICSILPAADSDDLKLDLEEGDASEAATLMRVDQETELRNWFANRLRQASRGRYVVPPEEELADA